jgi:hypothetical protein
MFIISIKKQQIDCATAKEAYAVKHDAGARNAQKPAAESPAAAVASSNYQPLLLLVFPKNGWLVGQRIRWTPKSRAQIRYTQIPRFFQEAQEPMRVHLLGK